MLVAKFSKEEMNQLGVTTLVELKDKLFAKEAIMTKEPEVKVEAPKIEEPKVIETPVAVEAPVAVETPIVAEVSAPVADPVAAPVAEIKVDARDAKIAELEAKIAELSGSIEAKVDEKVAKTTVAMVANSAVAPLALSPDTGSTASWETYEALRKKDPKAASEYYKKNKIALGGW
jgi:hypothetical protein